MYSTEEKAKAIKAYLENHCNAGKTVQELGYPTVSCMIKSAEVCEETVKKRPTRIYRIYTEEEKQHVIELYFENDCNLKKTVRELGYGSQKVFYLRAMNQTESHIVESDFVREQTLALLANEIKRKNVNGDVAELGVFRGHFSKNMNKIFRIKCCICLILRGF